MFDYNFYKEQYPNYKNMRDNVIKDKNRLKYHLMPPTGWLNDPNGLCQKDGIYHIYFQYSPYNSGWDTKIWGHYTSEDMISFNEEEPFLFPDKMIDRDGVYSGSAFVVSDIIHYFYTGNVKLTDKPDYDYINNGREQNTIHFTSKDGFSISEKELILKNSDYPQDMTKHVRDPKIFYENGTYYMVLGGRDKNDRGCILIYESNNLKDFKYFNKILTENKFGYMWECPDMFKINNKLFFVCCPQGVPQCGYKYENIYQTGYFNCEYDFKNNTYSLGKFKELDNGFDFYAPQTFEDEKGRRILYAWMGIPDADYNNQPTINYDWQHALTMPRLLEEKNGKIYQKPLPELKVLRKNEIKTSINDFNNIIYNEVCFEMNIKFFNNEEFKIQLREDVFLDYTSNVLTLSLGKSGYGRKERHIEIANIFDITIFSDTSSIEIFINEGEETFTTRVYSETLQQKVQFLTKNEGEIYFYSLEGYTIKKRT